LGRRKLTLVGHYPPPVTLEPNQPLLDALLALDMRGVRHAVVVDSNGRLAGILSIRRLLKALKEGYEEGSVYSALVKLRVEDVMYVDPPRLIIGEFDVEDVFTLMSRLNIGAVVVVDDGERVLGIVSEKHVAGILADGVMHVAVHEIMSRPARSIGGEATVYDAITLMNNYRSRHIPIIDAAGRLVSLITARDVVSYLASFDTISKLSRGLDDAVMGKRALDLAAGRVVTVEPFRDVGYALRLMRRHGISALPVVDRKAVAGIMSERDIVVKLPTLINVEIFYDMIKSKLYAARVVA